MPALSLPATGRRLGRVGRALRALDHPTRLKILMIIPLQLVLLVIVLFPFLMNLQLSFTNFQGNSPNEWFREPLIGLVNYAQLLRDPRFLGALGRTLGITAASLALECLLGMGLALLMQDDFRGKRLFTSIFLLPMMVIPIVSGFIFYMIFQQTGPLNTGILPIVLGRNAEIPWLTEPRWGFVAIIAAEVWQWTPLMFLIFSAGLAAIPRNIQDAAYVLGASPWQRLRYITLPYLKPIILIALVIRGVELFKVFDVVWLMTKGGPGSSTETISLFLYDIGFIYSNVAYAAAGAFLVLILVGVAAWYALKPLRIGETA
jgi:multiple sugar transport system permease protein